MPVFYSENEQSPLFSIPISFIGDKLWKVTEETFDSNQFKQAPIQLIRQC